jgi:ATP-dependent Clp protease ATP-binding subunit ClpC
MFERYSEAARRALFFCRYEASQLGAASIEPEHLALGLLREANDTIRAVLLRHRVAADDLRARIGERVRRQACIPVHIELPFDADTKQALRLAAQEADRLLHADIAPEHLLLGLLRVEQAPMTAILSQAGLQLDSVRETIVELRAGGPAG